LVLTAALGGCVSPFGPKAEHGITFYCPGAGVDLGDAGVREGLERAGYQGQVARATWSVSFNPAVDQTVRVIARQGGKRLAACIQEYMDRYPGREVNIVGLSAGTGVAVWALEALRSGYQVNNVVLIASSLYCEYDVSRALRSIKGRIYNYYSASDAVLAGPMKVFGTIDGVYLQDAAGAVGLRVPPGSDRVVNIPWRPEFERYGYYGGHVDGTNPSFVCHEIARYVVKSAADSPPQKAPATPAVTALQAARPG
jgi:pimeloyl-ACP methyl ester carboxylesterase